MKRKDSDGDYLQASIEPRRESIKSLPDCAIFCLGGGGRDLGCELLVAGVEAPQYFPITSVVVVASSLAADLLASVAADLDKGEKDAAILIGSSEAATAGSEGGEGARAFVD